MKSILSFIFLILFTTSVVSQVSKTVELSAPGTLSSILTSTEKATITNLTLRGNIDARDIKCLRDEVIELTVLDISSTTIKSYSGTLGTHPSVESYPANELPQYSFCTPTIISKNKLKDVVLPNSITSIGLYRF